MTNNCVTDRREQTKSFGSFMKRQGYIEGMRWVLDTLNDPKGATKQWRRGVEKHLKQLEEGKLL